MTDPYWTDGKRTIYHGDCREILPTLGKFDLLLTDPPYGIGVGSMGMGRGAKRKTFAEFSWDDEKPDSELLINARGSVSIVWGGNYFLLPASSCWLVWDKVQDFDGAHCELAWTDLDIPVRSFKLSRIEAYGNAPRYHPTQKPLALMRWCISFAPNAKTILDPFMGSGTTLLAAKLEGLEAVGIELSEKYCEAAVKRLQQNTLDFIGQ